MQQDRRMQECIDICVECQEICQETLYTHCLEMGGKHVEPEHVKIMADCIEACQTSANFMKRDSQMHTYYCAACAKVCEECAESCEEIGGSEMEACAEVCYLCAESCRQMGTMRKAA